MQNNTRLDITRENRGELKWDPNDQRERAWWGAHFVLLKMPQGSMRENMETTNQLHTSTVILTVKSNKNVGKKAIVFPLETTTHVVQKSIRVTLKNDQTCNEISDEFISKEQQKRYKEVDSFPL